MKLEPGTDRPLLASMDGTFSGGENETTTYIYSDRCIDLTGVPVRIRGRESATVSKN